MKNKNTMEAKEVVSRANAALIAIIGYTEGLSCLPVEDRLGYANAVRLMGRLIRDLYGRDIQDIEDDYYPTNCFPAVKIVVFIENDYFSEMLVFPNTPIRLYLEGKIDFDEFLDHTTAPETDTPKYIIKKK